MIIAPMNIDIPVIVPPNSPPNRPLTGDRLGGGGTAVIAETPRPVDDPEQLSAGRRNEEQATTEERQGRNAAELAGRARLEVALGQIDEAAGGQVEAVGVQTDPAGSGEPTTAPADTSVRAGTDGTGTASSGTASSGTAGTGTDGPGTAGLGTTDTGTASSGTAGTETDGSGAAGPGTGNDSVIPADALRSLQARLDVQLATAQQTEARGGVGQQLNELG